jgi:hypothetical protein
LKPKFSPGQSVKFTCKGKALTGVVQGVKDGDEPKYLVWVGQQYGWVKERLIIDE